LSIKSFANNLRLVLIASRTYAVKSQKRTVNAGLASYLLYMIPVVELADQARNDGAAMKK
jgi:hypothetical protein